MRRISCQASPTRSNPSFRLPFASPATRCRPTSASLGLPCALSFATPTRIRKCNASATKRPTAIPSGYGESGAHADPRGFGIGVAGFPEGHPETPNTLVQMDHLRAKVDAGADWVCTQMFFDNAAFYDWRERCELAGVRLPLVAGIMPIMSIAGMKRMADLAGGTIFPARLQRHIYRCQDDPDAVARVGVHWATEQCRDLIDHGVDGIHFYTLNKSDATVQIYQTLGAKDSAGLR